MASSSISTKKRLIFMLLIVTIIILTLIVRLGYIQIFQGDKLKQEALEQWTKDIRIEAKRGIIYDKNMKVLAASISTDTVWCTPADIKNPKETAMKIATILGMNEDKLYKVLIQRKRSVLIKRWIGKEQADALRKENISGIDIIPDTKRYYPYGDFASYILGFTNIDNVGLYGVERTFNKYLTGVPGRWMKTVDARSMEMPYNNERVHDPEDGLSIMLTIDETIQHICEKAAYESLVKNKAKKVSIIIMNPKNGDILALATKPDFDPNTRNTLLYDPDQPWVSNSEEEINRWSKLDWQQKEKILYDSWRNFSINDIYEPGSTFKVITAAAGLEEKVVTPESQFYCDGFVQQVKGAKIKCWRYYNPHGSQTFVEGAQNSCNEVFVSVGLRLGKEKMYEYVKKFGFGEKTEIALTGEQSGIVRSAENMREVNLATVSFGQGISVTPIQLITAVSAIGNGGNLMEPRIVKKIFDKDGNLIETFEPKVRRKVISKETSETLLNILESVVSVGTGKRSYVSGYRVGGKTGTAQKVIDGRYAGGKYIASFLAVAPVNDPQIAVLVIIDEPSNGAYYGGLIAAPVAGQVIKETLNYLDVEPQYTEEERKKYVESMIKVPEVRNKTIVEAGQILDQLGFVYSTETLEVQKESLVIDQFPLPGTEVHKGSIIDIYIQTTRNND